MAEELLRSKHAFGSSENITQAVEDGKVDAYDILFLDGDTDKPKIGWIDKNGNPVILTDEKGDMSEFEEQVDAKIEESVENAVAESKLYTDEQVQAAIMEACAVIEF